jgi:hypothetical protein
MNNYKYKKIEKLNIEDDMPISIILEPNDADKCSMS